MACALTKVTSRRTSPDKVTTNLPGSRGDVATTSPQSWRQLRDVFSVVVTSSAVSKVGQAASRRRHRIVAPTSPQYFLGLLGLQQVSGTSPQSRTKLVSETCWRLEKSPKKSNMSPPSLQANDIGSLPILQIT